MDAEKQIGNDLVIPSYASNYQRNMAEQYNNYGYAEVHHNNQDFQNYLKEKAVEVWEKRNEKNVLIIILCFLFVISLLFNWIWAYIFCASSLWLAIYEILPKLQNFKNDKKQIKKIILLIYLGSALAALIFSFIIGRKEFLYAMMQITAGQLIGFAISFLIIKKIKKMAKKKRLLNENSSIVDVNQTTDDNVNDDELGVETQFLALQENMRNYCFFGLIGVILLLWIIGVFAKIELFQFILYTILIIIIYEGTENIPFLSQLIRDKKFMLFILFSVTGTAFFLLSVFAQSDDGFLSGIFQGIGAMCFACTLSIFFFKKWKKLYKLAENNQNKSDDLKDNQLNTNTNPTISVFEQKKELEPVVQTLPISFKEQVNAGSELKQISGENVIENSQSNNIQNDQKDLI